jgi:hypothetical protein
VELLLHLLQEQYEQTTAFNWLVAVIGPGVDI